MARSSRLIIPFQPHYVFQLGLNGQAIFQDADDHQAFLIWLRGAAKKFKVAVHAYVLLPACVHLLVSPSDEAGLGQMMQWIGRYYVPWFNQKYQRGGTLWQGRYKTALLDAEPFLMLCSRHIEQTPVRAGLVASAAEYIWSSHAHHTGLRPDPVVTDHPLYWALGNTPFEREAAYIALSQQMLSNSDSSTIEQSVAKGWPLGSAKFKAALEHKLLRPIMPVKRGRPFKTALKN